MDSSDFLAAATTARRTRRRDRKPFAHGCARARGARRKSTARGAIGAAGVWQRGRSERSDVRPVGLALARTTPARFALRRAYAAQLSRLHDDRGADARARHRREYRAVLRCKWRTSQPAAISRAESSGQHGREQTEFSRRLDFVSQFPRLAPAKSLVFIFRR